MKMHLIEVCSQASNWQQVNIGNGLVPPSWMKMDTKHKHGDAFWVKYRMTSQTHNTVKSLI